MPDFLLIGTKRGGTTSMFHCLLGHPDVIRMFPERRLKSPAYFASHYGNGDGWYRSHFATVPYRWTREQLNHAPTVTGDSDPYYMYHPLVPRRVRRAMPDAKLVIMLRDPVRRAYSHYLERVANGVETLTFPAALEAESQRLAGEVDRITSEPYYYSRAHDWYSYRDRGVYAPQIRRWFEEFPREQVLVLASESFFEDQQSVVDEVTAFLGIRPYRPTDPVRFNTRFTEEMEPATRRELAAFFAPHNRDLYALLGRDFGWS
jgi:Sulfotransferase domain